MFFSSRLNAPLQRKRVPLAVEMLEQRECPAAPAGNDIIWRTYTQAEAFSLNSNPGARHTIFMDFDGATISGTQWNTDFNAGNPIIAQPWSMDANRAVFSPLERDKIIAMWRQVAEDFVPFDVNVTTQDPGVARLQKSSAGDTQYGMHAVISPTPTVSTPTPFPGTDWNAVGGIAYGNFNVVEPVDTPCWIFNGDSVPNPEVSLPTTVSHEVGHTLGLGHDGDSTQPPPNNVYYPGHGVGATSWGPIMGGAFGRSLDTWSRNTYPGGDNPQDDLQIITSINGFGYRPDDYANSTSGAKALNGAVQANLKTTYGIIGRTADVDVFSFYADPGPVNIAIDPLFIGANMDIRAELLSPTGAVISTSNPINTLNASFNLNITTKGLHYIRITNTGLAGPTGYSNYGILGNYRVSGTVTPFTPSLSSFKRLNPVRWAYNSRARTYSGYVLVANLTKVSFTGTFTFTFTLPDPSVKVLSGGGVQNGRTYTYTYRGTIAPGRPLKILLVLSNPRRFYLSTSNRSFITNMEFTA